MSLLRPATAPKQWPAPTTRLEEMRARLRLQHGRLTMALLRGDEHTASIAEHWVKLIEAEIDAERLRSECSHMAAMHVDNGRTCIHCGEKMR